MEIFRPWKPVGDRDSRETQGEGRRLARRSRNGFNQMRGWDAATDQRSLKGRQRDYLKKARRPAFGLTLCLYCTERLWQSHRWLGK